METELYERSNTTCELCGGKEKLRVFAPQPLHNNIDGHLLICEKCFSQITSSETLDVNHWRCLNDSMWSAVPAVQIVAWRMLSRLQRQGEMWAQDQLDVMYLDDDLLAWAKNDDQIKNDAEDAVIHKDSNGNVLSTGDTVVLIKDLDVKGGGFTAKRGTVVKSIALVETNAAQIEGKINGQQIVILTQYVKKQ